MSPPSSEAMAALFFENGATSNPQDEHGNPQDPKVGKWHEYAKLTKNCTEKKQVPRSNSAADSDKYEGRYSSSKAGSSTYGGWSDDGLLRYEALVTIVENARAKPHCAAVEKEILRRMRKDIWKTDKAPGDNGDASRRNKKKKVSVTLSLRI